MIGSTDKVIQRQECFEKPVSRPQPETSLKLLTLPGGPGHHDGCFMVPLEIIRGSLHRNNNAHSSLSMCALVFSPLLANSAERDPPSLDDFRLRASGTPGLGR